MTTAKIKHFFALLGRFLSAVGSGRSAPDPTRVAPPGGSASGLHVLRGSAAALRISALAHVAFVAVPAARAQSTVAYFDGPAFEAVTGPVSLSIDFDRDGSAELVFYGGFSGCTAGPGPVFCSAPHYITATGMSTLLFQNGELMVGEPGLEIGPSIALGSAWSPADLFDYALYSSHEGKSVWYGQLPAKVSGYFGVRFNRADGFHYGWVFARLPEAMDNFTRHPIIVDWAWETRPNASIRAGAKPVVVLQSKPAITREGFVRLRWLSTPGVAYQVQSKDRLAEPFWTSLPFVIPATASQSEADLPISGRMQFYRVLEAD